MHVWPSAARAVAALAVISVAALVSSCAGTEGAGAADVLFGDFKPVGRRP